MHHKPVDMTWTEAVTALAVMGIITLSLTALSVYNTRMLMISMTMFWQVCAVSL